MTDQGGSKLEVKTALNIPDLHIPFHDKKYLSVLLHVADDVYKARGINQINILGDMLDFYNVSMHGKLPQALGLNVSVKDEVVQGNKFLELLQKKYPDAEIVFYEGNHEFRLARYIAGKPDVFRFLQEFDISPTVESLLKIKERGITFHEFGRNGSHQLGRCLKTNHFLRHSPPSGGVNISLGSINKKHCSGSSGHTHRSQSAAVRDLAGNELVWYSLGWGGDETSPVFSYMDTVDWTKRFQFITQFSKDPWDYVSEIVEYKNQKALYNNHVYYCEDSGLELL